MQTKINGQENLKGEDWRKVVKSKVTEHILSELLHRRQ